MDYSELYQLKNRLVERDVPTEAAEIFARMYPFFLEYSYGINVPELARLLERKETEIRRYVRQLTEKNVLVRLNYRAWTMNHQAVKELMDASHR